MTHITDNVLRRLAQASRLTIPADAQERVVAKLDAVLSYAEILARSGFDPMSVVVETSGVLREDTVEQSSSSILMKLAPEQAEGYFLLPAVIKHEIK